MGSLSPTRRSSFSKHTSYPTANMDKKFKPGEVENGTKVNQRNADKELDSKKNIMDNIHRKSISQMDKERKQLEKSMMAYSEKMKSINNSRTNELFREIHSRGSNVGDLSDSCQCRKGSVSAFSAATSRSLPAQNHIKKAAHARRLSELRRLKGFSQVDVRSPILELRENTTPELRRSRENRSARSINSSKSLNNDIICQTERAGAIKSKLINARMLSKRFNDSKALENKTKDAVANDVKIVTTDENGSPTSFSEVRRDTFGRVTPKIPHKTFLPWIVKDTSDNDSLPDTAYSSGTDDIESVSSAVSSAKSSSNNSTEDSEEREQMLLTVPKIHIRRGKVLKKKKKSRQNQTEALFKKSVLNRVQRLAVDPLLTNRTC